MYLVPSVHPSFVLRSNQRYSGVFRHDFARAISLLRGWRPTWKDEHFAYKPSATAVEAFCKGAIERHATIAYDFETNGEHPMVCMVRCLGLYDGTHGICIPFLWRKGEVGKKAGWYEFYSGEDRKRVVAAVAKLLSSNRITAIAQNGQYDQVVAKARLGVEFKLDQDTMIEHHVAQSYLPHDLGFLGSIYTDICYYKSDEEGAKWSSHDDEQLWKYCLRDTRVCHIAHDVLSKELPLSYPKAPAIYAVDMRMANICRSMKETGVAVDPVMLAFLQDWYGQKETRALAKMRELVTAVGMRRSDFADLLDIFAKAEEAGTGEGELRPGSLAELRAVLTYLGVPLTALTETGLISTAKDFLLEARALLLAQGAKKDDPRIAFLDYLFAWRECSKVRGTFLKPTILPDGRVHVNFSVHVVPTGRLSSSDQNLQNQPGEIRCIYVAREGCSIVKADWDAGEMRIAGYGSGEPVLNDAFKVYDAGKGPKPHRVNASIIYGVPQDKVTKPLYEAAKRFIYACVAQGTKVALLDGAVPIEQVKPGDWTWCWDGKKYARTQVKHVVDHGVRSCIELTLQAGDGFGKKKKLVVTPDHKMLLRSGHYRAAGDLLPGDRLMPFRRYTNNLGYPVIDPRNDGNEVYEHHWVLPVKRGLHRHHKNGIKADNRPGNLEALEEGKHHSMHRRGPYTAEERRQSSARMKAAWRAHYAEYNARLSAGRRASKVWHAAMFRTGATRAAYARSVRSAQRKKAHQKPCWRCRVRCADGSNGMCKRCYFREWHRRRQPRTKNHVVVAIRKVGLRHVWDLEVDHPAHNFALDKSVFVSNCLYGAGPKTIFETCRKDDPDLSFGATVRCYERIKRGMPRLIQWQKELVWQSSKDRHQDSPVLGRRRWFFENGGDDTPETAAMLNNYPQSGLADVVTSANFRLQDDVLPKYPGAVQVLQVHDEIVFEVPDKYAAAFAKDYKKVAEIEVKKGWHLPVNVDVAKRWAPLGNRMSALEVKRIAKAWQEWQKKHGRSKWEAA